SAMSATSTAAPIRTPTSSRGNWPTSGLAPSIAARTSRSFSASKARASAPPTGRPNSAQAHSLDKFSARADLVLRLGLEIAGVVSFAQLLVKRAAGAVDHSPAL